MHLTLKFFGEIEQRRTIDICRCVERTLTAKHRFQISLVGLGAFPDLERPRTLWAGLGLGRDTLTSLQQSIDEDLTIEGHPSESRRYHPHITIGRVRSKSGSPGISAVIAAHVNEAYGELPVDRVVMYSSRLKRSGPVYTQLATMPLPDSRQ